jgi:hypothetical protein
LGICILFPYYIVYAAFIFLGCIYPVHLAADYGLYIWDVASFATWKPNLRKPDIDWTILRGS